MAKLELQYLSGDVETHDLSKREPLSIGAHVSNDVCIRDDDVAVMHCRISWAKKGYEVTAANLDGVEVNGTLVRQALLLPGDVLRIGSVDISVRYEEGEVDPGSVQAREEQTGKGNKKGGPSTSEVDLKPITEDQIFTEPPSPPTADAAPGEKGKPKRGKSKKKRDAEQSILDGLDEELEKEDDDAVQLPDDIFEEDEDEQEAPDEVAAQPMLRRSTTFAQQEAEKEAPKETAEEEGKALKEKGESLVRTLRARLTPKPVRPGEQDILQSPIVLILGGGAAVLLLTSLVFWAMISRETARRLYDDAAEELAQGKYTHAEKRFDEFLSKYPQHDLTELALIGRAKARTEKEVSGATPNWPRGLEKLDEFIDRCRDLPSFPQQHDKLCEYAEKIAMGAAQNAEQGALRAGKLEDVIAQESLLKVSRDAGAKLNRYSPPDAPPDQLQKQIEAAREKAEAAIRKQTNFYEEVAEIEKAIRAKKPMLALAARQRLLDNYPGFRKHKKVGALLEETLETERSLVVTEDLDRPAVTDDRKSPVPNPLSLTLHTRSRTDEASAGRTVFAVGKDCCYGIDTVTGDPAWRRVIGLDTPFFPIGVQTSVPAVLLFDTNHKELVLLNRVKGGLIWRQEIGEDLDGPPLIHEGQIYLPTLAKHLYRIDVDTGKIEKRLTFSQKVLAPPVLISYATENGNGNGLLVAGDVALLYTLSIRPLLACEAVSDLGHKAGSIQAPLVKMGRLVLMAENSHLQKSRLRALEVNPQTKRVSQAAVEEVDGQVRDTPVLRGKTLLVPFGKEQVAAFTASDDDDHRPLTSIATHPLQNPVPGPIFLFAGPDDQVWMASSALRKLYLKTKSIKLDPAEAAVGLSSQPLQSIGRWLYVGRQMPYSRAVFFTQTDRDEMTSYWRTIVGSRVLAATASQQGVAICVTEEGTVFRVTAEQIQQGGFQPEAVASLKLNEKLRDPLRAVLLSDGRIAVHCGAPEPQLWTVNQAGQIEQQVRLEAPLEANPVLMGTGIVVPLPGKLKYVGRRSSTARVRDFLAPVTKDRKATWVWLVALDENQLLVVDSGGKLARIQNRQQQLAEASKLQLDTPLDVGFCVHNGKIILADAKARLLVLNASSMDTISQMKLDAPASNSLWLAGERLLVETGRENLQCFAIEPELKRLWSVPLEGSPLAGEPVVAGKLLVLTRKNGDVWTLDPASGTINRRLNVGQPLSLGPVAIGSHLIASSIDGSLYRVESALQGQAQAAEKTAEKR